jgi:hypothetical protein
MTPGANKALALLATYLLVAAASASLTAYVDHAQLKQERAEHAAQLATLQLGEATGALQQLAGLGAQMRQVAGVIGDIQKEANANARTLQAGLAGLRTDAAGLRDDTAGVSQLLGGLTRSAVEQYASTCTGLLSDLAEEGREMAVEGAGIALSAQGHYIDDRAKAMSWPAPSRALSNAQKEKIQ